MFPGNLEVHFSLPPLPPSQKREKKLGTHGTPPHTRCACTERSFLAAPYQALLCRWQTVHFYAVFVLDVDLGHYLLHLPKPVGKATCSGGRKSPRIRERGRCLPASHILFGSSLSRWAPTGSGDSAMHCCGSVSCRSPTTATKGLAPPAAHPGLQVLSRIVSS